MDKVQKMISKNVLFKHASDAFFKYCDRDGNGLVDKSEIEQAVNFFYAQINKRLGHTRLPPSRDEILRQFSEMSKNGQGLTLPEFQDFMFFFAKAFVREVARNALMIIIGSPIGAIIVKQLAVKVPHVGPVLKHVPNSLLAPVVAAAASYKLGVRL